MTLEIILTIVFAVLTIIGAVVSYYLYFKNKITAAINGEIDDAEIDGKVGEEKMAEVITQLKKLIPAILRPFITDEMLQTLVQAAFDKIESYAEKQAKKQTNATEEIKTEATDENT